MRCQGVSSAAKCLLGRRKVVSSISHTQKRKKKKKERMKKTNSGFPLGFSVSIRKNKTNKKGNAKEKKVKSCASHTFHVTMKLMLIKYHKLKHYSKC